MRAASAAGASGTEASVFGRIEWGFAEFFVISQTALPALMFLPGLQPLRLYIRAASFVISFAALAWWLVAAAKTHKPHPAQAFILASMGYVVLMFFHPATSSTFAGLAQFVLYMSVIAPMFWAGHFVRTPEHLAHVITLLLICNGINATVGVLQVYDPDRWMPREFSSVLMGMQYGINTVSYVGPDGRVIVRPPGLFDNPGAVAGPAMYAALLGLVFATSALLLWKRLAAVAASFAGIAAIYLSQVRIALVLAVLMFAAYSGTLLLQNRRQRAILFSGIAAAIVVTTFSFALVLGGESIAQRTMSLFAADPVTLYSASRGGQLVFTFGELLRDYPLGAGLGRWGMIAGYFGPSQTSVDSAPIWAEIQVTAWAVDGGIALLLLSIAALAVTLYTEAVTALRHPDARVRACAAVIFAANIGTAALIFTFPVFASQSGMQFWFLAGALYGVTEAQAGRRA